MIVIVATNMRLAQSCLLEYNLGFHNVKVALRPEHVMGLRLGKDDTVLWHSDPIRADEVRKQLLVGWK